MPAPTCSRCLPPGLRVSTRRTTGAPCSGPARSRTPPTCWAPLSRGPGSRVSRWWSTRTGWCWPALRGRPTPGPRVPSRARASSPLRTCGRRSSQPYVSGTPAWPTAATPSCPATGVDRPDVACARTSAGGVHRDAHRDVVAGEAHDGQRVEDLVEAEPARARVGPLGAVDHRADRVGQATGGDQPDDRVVSGPPELWQEPHGHPAQREVDRHVEPARGAEPEHPRWFYVPIY